jgi:hypothetical protein
MAGRGPIDQERLVTPGKKMAAQFVSPVKTHRVCTQQPFHSLNQICSRGLYQQMKMIAHQTIGMHLPAGLLTRGTQGLEKTFSIQIVSKNLLTPIAPAHQMINSPLVLNSQLARHRQLLMQTTNLCQK